MSYLDQWKSAWLNASTKSEVFNLAQSGSFKKLSSKIRQFDLLVVLHTVTADSNSWLEKLSIIRDRSRPAMVMFIGNEFSSPFLSTEKRLDLIAKISPEFIATQLPIDSAKWLYERIGSKVIAAPPGMPVLSINNSSTSRDLDLGFRGFRYPWYLMDNERNNVVDQVIDVFKNRNLAVDVSHEKRLNSSEWFDFLSRSRFTVSSEAGAKYIFRDDQIWNPVKEYFATEKKFSALENDVGGMSLLRRLPAPLKSMLKKFLSNLGLNQGSLYKPDSKELEKLISLVDLEKYESRNGKCISSRHFDAIAAGTWQILAPGKYNELLIPSIHFTPWEATNNFRALIENEVSRKSLSIQAFDDLSQNHSYRARVNTVLREIG
jgi:hypothetical protein